MKPEPGADNDQRLPQRASEGLKLLQNGLEVYFTLEVYTKP